MGLRRRYYLPGAVVVLATILILAFFLVNSYRHTVRLVKERFFVQQALTTRQTALGIEKNFTLLERESELLAADPALRGVDTARTRAALQRTFDYVKRFSVNDISLANRAGVIRQTITSPELIGRDFSFRQYYRRLRESAGAAPTYEHITFQGFRKGRKGILIARAVRGDGGEFDGPLVFVIEVGDMMRELFSHLPQGTRGWVIDGDGIVLSHPTLEPRQPHRQRPGRRPGFRAIRRPAAPRHARSAGSTWPGTGEPSPTMATAVTIRVAGQPLSVVIETSEDRVRASCANFTRTRFSASPSPRSRSSAASASGWCCSCGRTATWCGRPPPAKKRRRVTARARSASGC